MLGKVYRNLCIGLVSPAAKLWSFFFFTVRHDFYILIEWNPNIYPPCVSSRNSSAYSSLVLCSASGELSVYVCSIIVHPETQGILIQNSGILYIAPLSVLQILPASSSPNSNFYSWIQQDHFVILGFPLFCPMVWKLPPGKILEILGFTLFVSLLLVSHSF